MQLKQKNITKLMDFSFWPAMAVGGTLSVGGSASCFFLFVC